MSLKTWKKEFCPTTAKTAAARTGAIKCIEHSLKKWEGALPENLEKHGLEYGDHLLREIDGPEIMRFDHRTCSLCVKYLVGADCRKCPIVKAGNPECDAYPDNDDDWEGVPIDGYRKSENNPQPMIDTLKKTLEFYKEGNHVQHTRRK